jgi:hypothetical protein
MRPKVRCEYCKIGRVPDPADRSVPMQWEPGEDPECANCWELRTRIVANPELAAHFLAELRAGRLR